ncbi:hypothetical protein OEW28_18585 [Defluviimonas sp. WL0002]|uniref:Uncharacterized protein n=1 Tax=Albidovulum marisflavi TaxID=2984159 RepID=A0ABT2ZHL1_9RHOB|nr:hypothetical protein [Defluviimonas sp. WL0002]MCV2870624.1 hypothetical protein [Defluviimonas sp. WL0002]
MSATFYRKAESVGIPLFIQLTDRHGRSIDLTGATNARVSLRAAGASGTPKVNGKPAAIADGIYSVPGQGSVTLSPVDGVIVWQPVAADIDEPGTFEGLVKVDFPSSMTLIAPDEGTFSLIVGGAF